MIHTLDYDNRSYAFGFYWLDQSIGKGGLSCLAATR